MDRHRKGLITARHSVVVAVIATLVACLQLLMAPSVFAHANLARAEPAPDSVRDKAPSKVTIWFTEPIEARFSEIQVLDAQGQRVDHGDRLADSNDPTALSVMLHPLPNGTYTVAWKNVSSVDGHSLRGSYLFSVGEPIAGGGPAATPEQPLVQSPADPVLRWLLLLGILAVVGGLAFELTVWRPALPARGDNPFFQRASSLLADRTILVTWAAMALFWSASVGQLFLQRAALGGNTPLVTVLTQTDWGRYWLWRMALFVLVAGILGASAIYRRRNSRVNNFLNILALVTASGLLLTLSLVSHSAAIKEIRLGAVFSDYLHLLAAGFWVGGLFHFALGMPVIMRSLPAKERSTALSDMVPRFSVLAILSVGTLVITGLYSAWAQVTGIPAVATPYGLTLLAKVALLVPLLVLGALNLLWVRPRLSRGEQVGRWLRRFVTSEALLAALVLLAAGLLTSMEPARQVASRQGIGQPKNLIFTASAEGANIAMAIDPGRLGSNLLIVSLTDRSGRPITNASEVTLQMSYLDGDIEAAMVPTVDHGGGVWLAHEGSFSIAGNWQAAVIVRRPDAFDARTSFRFHIAPGPGSSGIAPAADTGRLLWVVELVLLGVLFTAVGLALGSWLTRKSSALWRRE